MRHGGKWLAVPGILGIGLFIAMVLVLPKPSEIKVGNFFQAPLPQAQDRVVMAAPEATGVTLTFVGDIMLSRDVERAIVNNGSEWPFAKLGDLFQGSDMVVGNLEGTVRQARNLEVVNQMTFDTTPNNVILLAQTGFTHLSLANNHSDDYGSEVTEYTRETVSETGMIPFGDPLASEDFIVRESWGGIDLSLIGFHAFGQTAENIVQAIETEAAQGRFVIVYPHWGPEYVDAAPAAETHPAALFINAGADLIVGAHPHVIQNVEVIQGVPVIYSLGNFLFDQDFSAETKRGLTVQVEITEDNINLDFTPVNIQHRQTFPMSPAEAEAVFTEFDLGTGQLSVARE